MRRVAGWTTRQELEAQAHYWRCTFATLTFASEFLPESVVELRAVMRGWLMRLRRAIDYRVSPADGARVVDARPGGGLRLRSVSVFRGRRAWLEGRPRSRSCESFGLLPDSPIGDATLAELIEATWGRGRVDVRPLKRGGARYVAKYVGKAIVSPELELGSSMEFRWCRTGRPFGFWRLGIAGVARDRRLVCRRYPG